MSKVLKEPLQPIETISLGDEHDGIWGEDDDIYIEKRFAQKLIKAVQVEQETRHQDGTAETLARNLNIGLETARRTMEMTTQQGIRTAVHPIHKRYRIDQIHLHRRRLPGLWYTDTLFSKVTSLQGNTCAQVITNGSYVRVKPLESKKYCSQLLTEMEQDVGVPDELIADQAGETTGKNTEWMKEVRRLKIKMRWAEAGRKN